MSERAAAEGEGKSNVDTSGGRSKRVRVSPRDREMLAWVGRQRMVQAEQLAAREWPLGRFGDGRRALERAGRLSSKTIGRFLWSLERRGLVEGRRFYYADAKVWSITAAGL